MAEVTPRRKPLTSIVCRPQVGFMLLSSSDSGGDCMVVTVVALTVVVVTVVVGLDVYFPAFFF